MIGRSDAFTEVVTTPVDHVERAAELLELLVAEVRRFGVVDGSLSREREYAPDGTSTGVQSIAVNVRIDHAHPR